MGTERGRSLCRPDRLLALRCPRPASHRTDLLGPDARTGNARLRRGVTQFYEALRLPDYFGWNWNALRDCLTDLHWISAKHLLLIIDDADVALSESAEEREILFRALKDAVKFWAGKPKLPDQEKITFQAVLLCPPDVQEEVLREIRTY